MTKSKMMQKYRENALHAANLYQHAMVREDYTAAVIAAAQCVENNLKVFLTSHRALNHQLRESHNAAKLFTECAKLIQVKEQVHPLDLSDATDAYYLSQNPQKMESAEYSWEAAHTAGWVAMHVARVLGLQGFSLVF